VGQGGAGQIYRAIQAYRDDFPSQGRVHAFPN